MERFHRQLGIFDPAKAEGRKITVIGAGSVGSFTVLTLAKLGFEDITVYDFDSVEEVNIPNQFYPIDAIGMPKVIALRDVVRYLTGIDIIPKEEPYIDQPATDIVISAVDSMDIRVDLWANIKYKPRISQYIDARMGGEQMRIYSLNPMSPKYVEAYEANLYPSDEADELPCTERSVIYNVLSIASIIASLVKKHSNGEEPPFEVIYDLKTMGLIVNEKATEEVMA